MAKASDFEETKPEELFYFVDYSPEAERIGYSNYSYWVLSSRTSSSRRSLSSCCLILFLALTVFSFIAGHWQVSLHNPDL